MTGDAGTPFAGFERAAGHRQAINRMSDREIPEWDGTGTPPRSFRVGCTFSGCCEMFHIGGGETVYRILAPKLGSPPDWRNGEVAEYVRDDIGVYRQRRPRGAASPSR